MAGSSGRSQWERQQAAQRREAERRARELARVAKELEKRRRQLHLESQQRAAEAKTAEVDRQITVLDDVLTSVLPLAPLSFERLKVIPSVPDFDPGPLGIASPAPDWNEYAPMEPGGLSRIFGGAARHVRRTAEARTRYEAAVSDYRRLEDQRKRSLAAARAAHEHAAADVRRKAAKENAAIDARRAAFVSGTPTLWNGSSARSWMLLGTRMASHGGIRWPTGLRTGMLWWSSNCHPGR